LNWERTLPLIMEEILRILECRLQIVKLEFQFYIFGEERAVGEERAKHFLQINQFGPWKFWSLSAKLVPVYVASDMATHVRC
jgi:hypothetical protein